MNLKKIRFYYRRNVFFHRYIRLENNAKIVCLVIWENNVTTYFTVIIIVILRVGLLKCHGLKRRFFVLFRSTRNLCEIIKENLSLIHDSITENPKVSLVEKDKYIWVSST